MQRTITKSSLTVGELERQYISSRQAQGVTAVTLRDYEDIYRIFGNQQRDITEITQDFVENWINTLQETKKPVTVNHYIAGIRALLYFAMDRGYIPQFKLKLLRKQEAPIRVYSTDDLQLLIKKPPIKASFCEWRDWAIVNFFLATGCRVGTLCDIKLDDVDYKANEITYRHLKAKQTAIIPLSPQLKNVLIEYNSLFTRTREDGYLFPMMNEEQLNPAAVRCSMHTYFKNRGVVYNSIHAFRHTFTKMYILNGGNAFTLQKMLCHSDITMTQHYVHLFSDDLKQNYDKLSPLDNLKKVGKICKK